MVKKDYLERQIEAISNTFAAILFGKDKVKAIFDVEKEEDEMSGSIEDDILERMVRVNLSEKKFNEAEDIIFEALDSKKNVRKLLVALDFYNKLEEYDDETLEQNNYSREEIKEGVNKLKELYTNDR